MIAGTVPVMDSRIDLTQLSENKLRHLAVQMLATLDEKDAALHARDETIRQYRIRNEHLTHEIALL